MLVAARGDSNDALGCSSLHSSALLFVAVHHRLSAINVVDVLVFTDIVTSVKQLIYKDI